MRLAEDKGGIYWKYSKHDLFRRKYIMMSSKLVNESVNNWFRSYLRRYKDLDLLDTDIDYKKLEQLRERAAVHLASKFNLSDDDLCAFLIYDRTVDTTFDKYSRSYNLKNFRTGETMKFTKYNGYWFECGDNSDFIFFDYGDFYCMSEVFPLAYFCYICAEKWRMLHDRK